MAEIAPIGSTKGLSVVSSNTTGRFGATYHVYIEDCCAHCNVVFVKDTFELVIDIL